MRDRKSFENRILTKDSKTILAYRITLDSFEEFLKNNNYEITPENAEDIVQEYVNWFSIEAKNHRRGIKGHSPNTVWAYYSRVKKYLKHLKIHIDDIELPSKTKKDLHPLKLSEIHDIFKELSYKDVTLFLTQIQAGLRIGESVQLRKKHFLHDYDRLVLKIPPNIAKFKRGRTAVIGKEAGDRIKQILKKIGDDDLVFGTGENPISSRVNKEAILRNALIKIGLDMKYDDTGRFQINTHSFRAYFITRVSRHDPNIAKKLAGEKGYLLQYDRLTDEEYVENYLKFEDDLTVFDLTQRDQKQKLQQKELDEKNRQQITTQNEKIENLAKSLQSLENSLKARDKEWEEAMLKLFDESAKKFQDPHYTKKLQEQANLEMENGNFN